MFKTIGKAALWIVGVLAVMIACSVQADKQAEKRNEAEATRVNAANAIEKADALTTRVEELESRIDDLEAQIEH